MFFIILFPITSYGFESNAEIESLREEINNLSDRLNEVEDTITEEETLKQSDLIITSDNKEDTKKALNASKIVFTLIGLIFVFIGIYGICSQDANLTAFSTIGLVMLQIMVLIFD